jgi:hypothetical protein
MLQLTEVQHFHAIQVRPFHRKKQQQQTIRFYLKSYMFMFTSTNEIIRYMSLAMEKRALMHFFFV